MPVNTKHKEYNENIDEWEKIRDCIAGEKFIKKRGSKYLPMPAGMDSFDFEAYLNRPSFYNATSRTQQGLLGAVFRKDLVVEDYNDAEHLEELTPDKESIHVLARKVVKNQLGIGRCGLLIDTIENAERSWISFYTSESIVNWQTKIIDGIKKTTLVTLREDRVEVDKEDSGGFTEKTKEAYRVLRLANNVYQQELYIKHDKKDQFILENTIIPRRNGVALDYIPFVFVNANSLTADVEKAPLIDLANLNISHFVTNADLEHGAHYTALPMAYFAGFEMGDTIKMGSSNVMVTDNADATAGYLEYTGQGLGALRDIKQDKEKQMANLGARLLEDPLKGSEAEATRRLRMSGESGVLADIVGVAGMGLEKALRIMQWWHMEAETATVSLNKDFYDHTLDAQQLTALLQALQGGAMSYDTFFYNLQKGEVTPPDIDLETELELIESRLPTMVEPQEENDGSQSQT